MPFGLGQDEQLNDDVEEIRELLYNILKDFPTGVTSTFLEELYKTRYVTTGLTSALPDNWLNLLRQAEEFHIRNVSTYTILYPAHTKVPQQQNWAEALELVVGEKKQEKEKVEMEIENPHPEKEPSESPPQEPVAPIAQFCTTEFEPVLMDTLPQWPPPIPVRIMTALDPDSIYFRLTSWDPYCEYLYSALNRLPMQTNEGMFQAGQILAAKMNGLERVELVQRASADPRFWIVYFIDCGFYSAVYQSELRPLSDAVTAFKKVFLARFKLDGIQSRAQISLTHVQKNLDEMEEPDYGVGRVCWPPETQHYVSEALQALTLKEKHVELLPSGVWHLDKRRSIPMCEGRLLIDGVDFGEQLVSMGLAQKKS